MVFIGAAVGAPLRYLVDRFVQSRHESDFPYGTLTVNVVGCFVLGLLTGASSAWIPLLGTGLCGGLTTYSTFSYETVRLFERREYRFAALNTVVSVVVGVGAARLGLTLESG